MAQILIIDGSAEFRGILSQALVHLGHRVAVAEDGWKAVVGFRRHGADLVIIDLLAPEAEVIQTIVELRSMSHMVKIMAMSRWSGLASGEGNPSAKALGIDATISKPFSLTDLIVAIDELVPSPATSGVFRACS